MVDWAGGRENFIFLGGSYGLEVLSNQLENEMSNGRRDELIAKDSRNLGNRFGGISVSFRKRFLLKQ